MQEWEERALERQEAEARGREEGERIGREEGERIGEARLSRLFSLLITEQKQEELKRVLTDEAYREELYRNYSL